MEKDDRFSPRVSSLDVADLGPTIVEEFFRIDVIRALCIGIIGDKIMRTGDKNKRDQKEKC